MRITHEPRSRCFSPVVRLLASPTYSAITVFALLYLASILFAQQISRRDPGSLFFAPKLAYQPIYSDVRKQQADDYIAAASNASFVPIKSSSPEAARLCVGLPSVARHGVRYLRSAVGALVEGLSPEEREQLYLIVFIAQADPDTHPAFHEPWLRALVDEVLTYEKLPANEQDHIRALEADPEGWREKELYDYKYILNGCYSATSAPAIAVFEDDTIAMDGWYHRTMHALNDASALTRSDGRKADDFLYLRLFHTEEYLGFNSEDWRAHTGWSLAALALLYIAMTTTSRLLPHSYRKFLTVRTIAFICIFFGPLFVVLFFMTGKVTLLPRATGVAEMSNYGCCAQGLVFPRSAVPGLLAWYDSRRLGFVDTLMEEYAESSDELRYALTPPVIQHVGGKSSKKDSGEFSKNSMTIAERLWSFAFELNDAEALRHEHVVNSIWPAAVPVHAGDSDPLEGWRGQHRR